jgi:hypothetical protein
MDGGTVNHVPISNGEAGAVPRTLNDIPVKLAFRKRAAEMGARLSESIYMRAAPDQQNWRPIVLRTNWFSLDQIRFRQHRCELVGKFFGVRMVYTDFLSVSQMSA